MVCRLNPGSERQAVILVIVLLIARIETKLFLLMAVADRINSVIKVLVRDGGYPGFLIREYLYDYAVGIVIKQY
jgi:hypothetical protein